MVRVRSPRRLVPVGPSKDASLNVVTDGSSALAMRSSSWAPGRAAGSTWSARLSQPRSHTGALSTCARPSMMLKQTASNVPVPNGGAPVAAKNTVEASACTSAAWVISESRMISGAR